MTMKSFKDSQTWQHVAPMVFSHVANRAAGPITFMELVSTPGLLKRIDLSGWRDISKIHFGFLIRDQRRLWSLWCSIRLTVAQFVLHPKEV